MHDPALLPDGCWHIGKAGVFPQGFPELGPHELAQRLHRYQEVLPSNQPGLPIFGQTTSGNQVVHMRMIGEVPSRRSVIFLIYWIWASCFIGIGRGPVPPGCRFFQSPAANGWARITLLSRIRFSMSGSVTKCWCMSSQISSSYQRAERLERGRWSSGCIVLSGNRVG